MSHYHCQMIKMYLDKAYNELNSYRRKEYQNMAKYYMEELTCLELVQMLKQEGVL